jgi:hypothetical protein
METVAEAHEELFHYTTAAGLWGIVASGTLWATHFYFLNDHQEYRLFFDQRLPEILKLAVEQAYTKLSTHPFVTHDVRKLGGAEAYKSNMRSYLLPVFRKYASELNTPYVACFCSAENRLVAEHGLLSQWRGYGADGGYALVFDTTGIDRIMRQEAAALRGMDFFVGDVEYYDDPAHSKGVHSETEEQTKVVVDAITNFVTSGMASAIEPMFTPVHRLACMAKHWGFREEREVRIVLSQPHETVVAALPDEHRLKRIRHFIRGGVPVPYMALLDTSDTPVEGRLPLRRVIVGPHSNSESRRVAVELLLRQNGYDVPVVTSAIPYHGR